MGQAARHGKGANIHQGLNGVSLQDCNEFIQQAGGMADGVESRHYVLARSFSRDFYKSLHDRFILLGEYSAQIEQHAAVLDSRDDGWIGGPQA